MHRQQHEQPCYDTNISSTGAIMTFNQSSDEDPVPIPPSAERVAARALVLCAVICRSAIEGDAHNPAAEAFRSDVVNWLRDVGVMTEVEQSELELLECTLGGLTDRQRVDASWRAEGLVVLGWSLGRCRLPAYDDRADPYPIAQALGFREPRQDTVLGAPHLCSSEEIGSLADTYFSLHWRLRQFSLDHREMNFAEFARTAWFGPLPLTGLRLISDDLEIRGKSLPHTDEPDWREVMSIARERQQAANWLGGQEALYSQVTCDT